MIAAILSITVRRQQAGDIFIRNIGRGYNYARNGEKSGILSLQRDKILGGD